MEWYYVYVLESDLDQSWYIGYSRDLEKRLCEHNAGKTVTTSKKMPWKIIYYEANRSIEDAIAREKYLKSGMGRRYLKNRMKHYFKNF
ncbi:MAG: GIY-YIG nuclease family protein [Saprospiraceae bacterium]|nr:GIY-YIG nuclease family protein [Saprospiraceae bacterium]